MVCKLCFRVVARFILVGLVSLSGLGIIQTPLISSVAQAQDPEIPPSDTQDLAAPDLVDFPPYTVPTNNPVTSPYLPTDPNYWIDKDAADLIGAPATNNPDIWATILPSPTSPFTPNTPIPITLASGVTIDYHLSDNISPDFGNIFGSNSNGGPPPDTAGTMGKSHYIAVVNNKIWIYKRTPSVAGSPTLNNLLSVANRDMTEFMHYTTHELNSNGTLKFPNAQYVCDTKIIYDRVNDRYIVVCISCAFDNPTTQYLHMAVSRPFSAGGTPFVDDGNGHYNYYVYHWNMARVAYDFWDQPMIGQDQNAIVITGNIYGHFNAATGRGNPYGSNMFSVRKSDIYNGIQPRSIRTYRGLQSTLQPPNVLDTNPNTYLVVAPSLSGDVNRLLLYRLTNTNQATTRLYGYYVVPLPRSYRRTRSARQPFTKDHMRNGSRPSGSVSTFWS